MQDWAASDADIPITFSDSDNALGLSTAEAAVVYSEGVRTRLGLLPGNFIEKKERYLFAFVKPGISGLPRCFAVDKNMFSLSEISFKEFLQAKK